MTHKQSIDAWLLARGQDSRAQSALRATGSASGSGHERRYGEV